MANYHTHTSVTLTKGTVSTPVAQAITAVGKLTVEVQLTNGSTAQGRDTSVDVYAISTCYTVVAENVRARLAGRKIASLNLNGLAASGVKHAIIPLDSSDFPMAANFWLWFDGTTLDGNVTVDAYVQEVTS